MYSVNIGTQIKKYIIDDFRLPKYPNPVWKAPYRPPLTTPSAGGTGVPEFIILNEDEVALTEI